MAISLMIAGLLFTAVGAGVTAWAVIISRQEAEKLAGTYYGGNNALRDALVRQSRGAAVGLGLIAIGIALQIAAVFVQG